MLTTTQVNPKMAQIKNMVNMIKGAGNPQAMISSMLQSNPQVTSVINQYGGDPKKAFYAMAEKQGVNPNDILNMLK